ncbi:MAG: hypothetical protein ACO3JL_07440 [Myxococcota bacterium]
MTDSLDDIAISVPVLWDDGYRYGGGWLLSVDEQHCVLVSDESGAPRTGHVRITPLLQGRDGLFELEGDVEETAPVASGKTSEHTVSHAMRVVLREVHEDQLRGLRQHLSSSSSRPHEGKH